MARRARMIPESFIQSLLDRVDIVDVVGRYVPLRKAGANLLGLCPFHDEKSPSFTVSPTKQFYHCFGCGAHGTAIRFLMEQGGMSFPESVRQLADSLGMVVPDDTPAGPAGAAIRKERARVQEEQSRHEQVLEAANGFYQRQLRQSPEAIAYLKQRGLTGQIAKQYGLGWTGSDRQGLAQVFDDYHDPAFGDFLIETGLMSESDDGRRYDRFRQRVTFPIRNGRGRLVGFGGRLLGPGEPKYLNSPETPVFSKGRELYGLWEARQAIRQAGRVIVVEGYMDVVALAQMGIGHAVATLGTSTTAEHTRKLLRVSDHILFSFDGDRAGRQAAWRALQACLPWLRDDVVVRFLFLPDGQDPDSFVRAQGVQAFHEAEAGAAPLSRFLLDTLAERHDMETAEGRSHCLLEGKPLMQALPAGTLRLQLVRELASMVRLTTDEIGQVLALQDQPSGPLVAQGREAGSPAASASGEPQPRAPRTEHPGGGGDDVPGFQPRERRNKRQPQGDGYPPAGSGGGGGGRGRITPLSYRLLRLLAAYPALGSRVDAAAEVWLAEARDYELVRQLLNLLRQSGAGHTGALLAAAEQSALAEPLQRAAAETLLTEDLPAPDAELDAILRQVELQVCLARQVSLANAGLATDEARERYSRLATRIRELRQLMA